MDWYGGYIDITRDNGWTKVKTIGAMSFSSAMKMLPQLKQDWPGCQFLYRPSAIHLEQ